MPFFEIDGTQLNYTVEGEGSWLILLHGFGSSLRDWELHRPVFAESHRVLSIDFRGFGESSKDKGPFTVERFTSDVLALMDFLDIRSTDVIGYSLGGAVAFELAATAPDRLGRLILVNTWASFRLETMRRRWEGFMRTMVVRFFSLKRMAHILAKRLFPHPHQAEFRAVFIERYQQNDPKVYLALIKQVTKWSVVDRLDLIHHPTLAIMADNDYTPVEEKMIYVDGLRNCIQSLYPGAGHALPFTELDRFMAESLAFLADEPLPIQL